MSPFYTDSSNSWEYPVLLTREMIENGEHKKTIEDMVQAVTEKVEELAILSPHDHFQIITYGTAGIFYASGPPLDNEAGTEVKV